jgi:Fe-S cluster assembly protein SufD
MVELQERTPGFEAHLESALSGLSLAAHLAEQRRSALAEFLAAGLPTHRDEEFKYTPFRELAENGLMPAEAAVLSPEGFVELPIASLAGPRIVFVNGRFDGELSNLSEHVGLTLQRLDPVDGRIGTLANYDGKLGSTNDPRFVRLNDALWSDGALISVARNAVLEDPIQVIFVSMGDQSTLTSPRVWIELEENAQAKVVETYVGKSGPGLTNAVTEIRLARRAILEHDRIQHEAMDAHHVGNVFAFQEAESTLTSNNVQFGALVGRCDINVWIDGEHTETWLNGAYVGKGQQVLDNHTRIDHAKPNCHSFEAYKGILSGQSTGVFNGKIFVYEDAQKTDAKQTNQALLLSPTATINTKPQLEIFADDVKCTHGATVGQLREDAMFYLRSRGISQQEARNLLVYAFVAEVLEKITVEPLREYLEAELVEQLNR